MVCLIASETLDAVHAEALRLADVEPIVHLFATLFLGFAQVATVAAAVLLLTAAVVVLIVHLFEDCFHEFAQVATAVDVVLLQTAAAVLQLQLPS